MTISRRGGLVLAACPQEKGQPEIGFLQGGTVKIWKNLLWIISLIAFGFKSNWRLELPLKRWFAGILFLAGGWGVKNLWLKIGGKVPTQMDLMPEKCHLRGIYWITSLVLLRHLVFVFNAFPDHQKKEQLKYRFIFLASDWVTHWEDIQGRLSRG